jgi:hypothetical protein
MSDRGWNISSRDRQIDLRSFTPMELVDMVLDREFGSQDEMLARAIIDADPRAAEALARSEAMLDILREPIAGPDLSGAILEEVGARREWLPPVLQRLIPVGRLAAAAVLLVVLSAGLLARRANPDAAIFQSGPTPVADVVRAGATEAAAGVQSVTNVLDLVRVGAQQERKALNTTLVIQVQSTRPCPLSERASRAKRDAGCASEALAVDTTDRLRWYGEPIESKGEKATEDNRWNSPPRQ